MTGGEPNMEEFLLVLKATGMENWREVGEHVWKLNQAATAAAGTEGGNTGFAGLSRQMFMAERAANALFTGQGLARAGPMLEAVSAFVGGPAGIGFLAGGIALLAEQYIPRLISHFDLMGTGAEKALQKVQDSLNKTAEHWRQTVEKMAQQPAPVAAGQPDLEKQRREGLNQLFNIGTLPGAGGIEHGLITAVMGAGIATPSEEEQKELDNLTRQRTEERNKSLAMSGVAGPGHTDEERKAAEKAADAITQKITDQLQALQQRIVQRRADQIINEATQPGEKGKKARDTLRNLINQFPGAFRDAGKLVGELSKIGQADDNARFFQNLPSHGEGKEGDEDEQLMLEIDQMELARGVRQRSRQEMLEDRVSRAMQGDWSGYRGVPTPGYQPRHPRRPIAGHAPPAAGEAGQPHIEGMGLPSNAEGIFGSIPHSAVFPGEYNRPREQKERLQERTPEGAALSQRSRDLADLNTQLTRAQNHLDSTLGLMRGTVGNQAAMQQQLEQQRQWIDIIRAQIGEVSRGNRDGLRKLQSMQNTGSP